MSLGENSILTQVTDILNKSSPENPPDILHKLTYCIKLDTNSINDVYEIYDETLACYYIAKKITNLQQFNNELKNITLLKEYDFVPRIICTFTHSYEGKDDWNNKITKTEYFIVFNKIKGTLLRDF